MTIRFIVAIFVDSYAGSIVKQLCAAQRFCASTCPRASVKPFSPAVMSRAPPRLWVFPPLSSLITGVKSWFLEYVSPPLLPRCVLACAHALQVELERAPRNVRPHDLRFYDKSALTLFACWWHRSVQLEPSAQMQASTLPTSALHMQHEVTDMFLFYCLTEGTTRTLTGLLRHVLQPKQESRRRRRRRRMIPGQWRQRM